MNDYQFFVTASETARAGFEKQTPAGASFSAFRLFAKGINQSLVKDREQLDKEKQEITSEYNPKKAGEKIAELESIFNKTVAFKQDNLRKILDRLITTKRSAIEQFTCTPPTDRQLRLIDSVSRRDGNISDTEWNMIVNECSSNYQASAILNDFAKNHGKDYALPFEPEEDLKDLDNLNERLTRVVDHISEKPLDAGLDIAEFFAHDDSRGETYGVINLLCEKFDSSSPAYVAESLVDLTDLADLTARLLEARGVAYHNGAKDLFGEIVKINMDIRDNGLNEDNLERAEKLIVMVNTLYPSKRVDSLKSNKQPESVGKNIADILNPSDRK